MPSRGGRAGGTAAPSSGDSLETGWKWTPTAKPRSTGRDTGASSWRPGLQSPLRRAWVRGRAGNVGRVGSLLTAVWLWQVPASVLCGDLGGGGRTLASSLGTGARGLALAAALALVPPQPARTRLPEPRHPSLGIDCSSCALMGSPVVSRGCRAAGREALALLCPEGAGPQRRRDAVGVVLPLFEILMRLYDGSVLERVTPRGGAQGWEPSQVYTC